MVNRYAQFDGSTGYITVPSDSALNLGTGDFTITVRANTTYDSTKFIMNKYGGGVGYFVRYLYQLHRMELYTGGSVGKVAYFDLPVGTNGWHHIVFVKSSSTVTAYFDGLSQTVTGSADTTNIDSVVAVTLGKFAATNFLGSIDDLRIYKAALTSEEIANIYNSGMGTEYNISQTPVSGPASFVLPFNSDFDSLGRIYDSINNLAATKTGGVSILSFPPYGSNLITNGTFNSDLSDWSYSAGISWVSGAARSYLTSIGTSEIYQETATTSISKEYQLMFTINNAIAGSSLQVYFGDDVSPVVSSFVLPSGYSSYSYNVKPLGRNNTVKFVFTYGGSGTNSASLDNVVLREINPTVSMRTRSRGFYGANKGFYRK